MLGADKLGRTGKSGTMVVEEVTSREVGGVQRDRDGAPRKRRALRNARTFVHPLHPTDQDGERWGGEKGAGKREREGEDETARREKKNPRAVSRGIRSRGVVFEMIKFSIDDVGDEGQRLSRTSTSRSRRESARERRRQPSSRRTRSPRRRTSVAKWRRTERWSAA